MFATEFAYLQVDAVYIRVRKSSNRKVGTMIVIGIGEDGHKEVLHFTIGTESARHFDEVLQRCTVHKTENIIEKCPTNLRLPLLNSQQASIQLKLV